MRADEPLGGMDRPPAPRIFSGRHPYNPPMSKRAAACTLLSRSRAWLTLGLVACGDRGGEAEPPAGFVGRETCVGCHADQGRAWDGSDHDLAMAEARADTVLGDFGGSILEHRGQRFAFRKDGERFLVDTAGADGAPATFEVTHTFGVDPLQQVLVTFPDGRRQALAAAWDARPAEQGGQRWFHLYQDEPIPPGDALHWTGPNQNWNYMCADCHSTGLERRYDPKSDTFDTRWAEIDVSCEACHGPGSRHVAWARGERRDDPTHGLTHRLADHSRGTWEIDPATGNARRSTPRTEHVELETCARCHARRAPIHEASAEGQPLLDDYRLSLLETGLYHADGQILEEVYEHGSFLQSRMYQAGVTCSDCHDPHSLEPHFPGNALCARCHLPAKYDDPAHHHHAAGAAGSACVDCHMPERTYMVVDPRRDHSLRVPRPDLSVELGTPNACQGCHAERGDAWAAERVAEWFPGGRQERPHWARAFAALRREAPEALPLLVEVVGDAELPGIVRASALAELGARLDASGLPLVQANIADPDPLVRAAAVGALQALPPIQRMPLAFPLLEDPVRLVRIEAARLLADVPGGQLLGGGLDLLERGYEEYEASLRVNADRADAQLGLGLYLSARGRSIAAEAAYRRGLELDPSFVANYANLAELLRARGDEPAARAVLERGIATTGAATLHHALGLALVRAGERERALVELARAADLAPGEARFAYVYAVALRETGDGAGSLAVLQRAHDRHPRDLDVLHALATFLRDDGQRDAARGYAAALVALAPSDPNAQALLAELAD